MLDGVDSPPLIAAHHVRYAIAGIPLWRAVSFHLGSGGLVRIHGPNGSGKSTLLRVLAGLLTPFGGSIALDGRSATAAMQRQAVAYLGHRTGLKADLTVRENLELACALQGRRTRQLPDDVIAMMQLHRVRQTRARHLSAGQQRRLALGRLWLCPASIWLIDEPYANLDQDAQAIVNRLLSAHRRDGGVAIITAHDCNLSLDGAVNNVALTPHRANI